MNDDPVEVKHEVQHHAHAAARFCISCGGEMVSRIVKPDNRRWPVCSRCGFVHFSNPKLVAGCLVENDGQVLLLRRGIPPRLGAWTFPGGYVDAGETPLDAAGRETWEEVRMHVTPGPLIGLYCEPPDQMYVVAVFHALPGAEPPGVSNEATEVRYFGRGEIPWDELAFPSTVAALRDWVKRAP